MFSLCFQTIIFSFQTIFYVFSHTFSPTRIFTNIFKQQYSIFESDAALAVQAVSQGSCDGEIGHIVQGILEAKSSFLDCSFRHVNRAFNEAAHKLAQFAKWNSVSHVWKDDFPLFWNSLSLSALS